MARYKCPSRLIFHSVGIRFSVWSTAQFGVIFQQLRGGKKSWVFLGRKKIFDLGGSWRNLCVSVRPSRFLRGCWFDAPDRVARFFRGSFVPVGSIFFFCAKLRCELFFLDGSAMRNGEKFFGVTVQFSHVTLNFSQRGRPVFGPVHSATRCHFFFSTRQMDKLGFLGC